MFEMLLVCLSHRECLSSCIPMAYRALEVLWDSKCSLVAPVCFLQLFIQCKDKHNF